MNVVYQPEWMLVCDGNERPVYWIAADGARRPLDNPPDRKDWAKEMLKNDVG